MTKILYLIGTSKKFPFFIVFLLALYGSISSISAQTTIQGIVFDKRDNVPITGAAVLIKGGKTDAGTVTDIDGRFEINVPSLPATIVVSYIGYRQEEIDIYEKPDEAILIPLQESLNTLNEVVVIGYGTQKRSDFTGSVTTVPSVSLNQITSSFERTLQGAVSGVQITQNSGQPGGSTSIRIRGSNSINGGNEPLFVIDGFPVYNDNSLVSSNAVSGGDINALASINPSDVESIDVLKDASATAIYGSRGANGVIMITTKKGKAGKSVVAYDVSYGEQRVIHPIEVITDSKAWARVRNDARVNAGKKPFYTEEQIAALPKGTDWQKAGFRNALIRNHQLSVSGGNENTRYAISGNYFDQEGVLKNTDFKRYSARINLDQQVFTRLKVGTSLTASRVQSQIADGGVVRALLLMPPVVSVRDASGEYTYQSEFESPLGNPVATLEKEINHSTTYRLFGNIYGEYDFGKGLSAKVSFGTDVITNKENRFIPSSIYQGANSTADSKATVGSKTSFSWLNENTVSYAKTIRNIHSFTLLGGYTQQAFRSERVLAGSQGFVTDLLTYNDLGSGSIYNQPGSSSSEWALNSVLGRINYAYKSTYYVTVTARADGSSRFGKNEKWGYFPSAALAWNLTNASFVKLPKTITNLKLRASAGITGNQEIGQYNSLSTLADNLYYFGGSPAVGFSPNRIGNPDLGWEKTAQYDAGIDISFFKDRLTVVVDWYYKKTTDLLLNVPLPYTTGQSEVLLNYGSVANKGFELETGTNLQFGKVSWDGNLTYSVNRNKVLSLGKDSKEEYIISGVSIAEVGQPLGSFYGLKADGVFQSDDDIANLPVYLTKNQPGDQRYVDINHDNKITAADDRVIIGNAEPDFIGGFINNFGYRNFDLNIFFQGSYGNQVYNRNKEQLEILSGQQNVSVTALDRWTPENQGNEVPRAYEDPAVVINSRNVEDASYLRLKELSFGYTLPRKLISKWSISSLRIYVSAQNLITLTRYSGFDPEVSTNQATINQGIDNQSYPNAKSIYGGLSIKF
ncbi:MAG: TonB-dependent receptor [Tannerella sp.]|jgi:TonB-linked SusC/RagA family outer membrane protein|nr:TonB-dependent receptor [Tannerella sp.]